MMKSKWVAVALVASLAINLALAGFIVGRFAFHGFAGDPTRDFPLWMASLTEARREALRPLVVAHIRKARPSMRTLRQHHRDLQRAIVAEPFAADALAAVLQSMRAQNEDLQSATHEAFVEFVSNLTLPERQALADNLGARGDPRLRRNGPPRPGFIGP